MDSAATKHAYAHAAREVLTEFPIRSGSCELVSVSENVTFRVVDAQNGAVYVLRLHRPGYHTLAELESERVWIRALAAAGIDVPVPIAARDGRVAVAIDGGTEHRLAGVWRWIDGDVLGEVLRRTDDALAMASHFEGLGALAACMHAQAAAWQPPAGFARHALDVEGLLGEAPFWGRFWDHPDLAAPERELMLATRERIRRALERHGRPPSTFSVIHADLHAGNVLLADERLTVIDFDDAGFGWHQYDIAVALFGYRTHHAFEVLLAAFVRGYRTRRELPDAALSLVPMFLLVRGMAIIGWMMQRPELDHGRGITTLKAWVREACLRFAPPC